MLTAPRKEIAKRKKILFIHNGQGFGGSGKSLWLLIDLLTRNNFECIVLMRYKDESVRKFEEFGAKVVFYPWLYMVGFTVHDRVCLRSQITRVIKLFMSVPGNIYWVLRIQPDIIHLNDITLGYLCIFLKIFRKPIVVHRRILFHEKTNLKLNINAVGIRYFANYVISIAEAYKYQEIMRTKFNDVVIQNISMNERISRDLTIYDPETTTYHKTDLIQNRNEWKRVLFIGSTDEKLQQMKGQSVFENAIKIVNQKRKDIVGCIVGGPPRFDKPQLNYLTYTGSVPDVSRYIENAELIVIPFVVNHCARQIFEAFNQKVAVICSNFSCLTEFVIDCETGFIVEPNNYEMLAEKILEVIDNKILLEKISKNAYNIFNQIQESSKLYTLQLFNNLI